MYFNFKTATGTQLASADPCSKTKTKKCGIFHKDRTWKYILLVSVLRVRGCFADLYVGLILQ